MKCQHQVQQKGMNFHRTRQCKNDAIEGETYCAVHSPEAIKKRANQSVATAKDQDRLRKAMYYVRIYNKNP